MSPLDLTRSFTNIKVVNMISLGMQNLDTSIYFNEESFFNDSNGLI